MGPLEWVETVLKLGAVACGAAALALALMDGRWSVPAGPIPLARAVILGGMAAGLTGAIWERYTQKETIAMGFVLANNLGHWGAFTALFAAGSLSPLITAFSGLMLAGDVTKLAFFLRHDFTVRGAPRLFLLAGIACFAAGYAVLLALTLLSA
jgi:hypothetical protein